MNAPARITTDSQTGFAHVRAWMGWATMAAGTLLWLADLARWLAPA